VGQSRGVWKKTQTKKKKPNKEGKKGVLSCRGGEEPRHLQARESGQGKEGKCEKTVGEGPKGEKTRTTFLKSENQSKCSDPSSKKLSGEGMNFFGPANFTECRGLCIVTRFCANANGGVETRIGASKVRNSIFCEKNQDEKKNLTRKRWGKLTNYTKTKKVTRGPKSIGPEGKTRG